VRRLRFVIVMFLLVAAQARAELPLIRLDQIYPLGGGAGTTVTLDITGRDVDDVKALHFDHRGFKTELIKPNRFKVAIAADVPTGTYEVRAVGTFGISGARLFAVNHGLTDVNEVEPNDDLDKAQSVPVNCAVSGRSDNNGDDFFRFRAKKGQRVVIDCQAFRLDSMLRAQLTLSTADGKELLRSKPYYHRADPLLDFAAPADGDYVLRLHDVTFNGGLPYRLVISDHPHIENAFPSALVPGEPAKVTLLGRNLPGGKPASWATLLDRPLEEVSVNLTAPNGPRKLQAFESLEHFGSPNVSARGLQLFPPGWKLGLNPATFLFADAPLTLDREPNDSAETAQTVTLPAVICGRFDRPGDADCYVFNAKKGDKVAVDLLCERLGFPGDPFVVLFDSKGAELAGFDDHGINQGALAQFNRDPLGTFNVPADGQYRIFVQERYRQGGPRYQYVLRLTKAAPDFFPVAFPETPADPSCPVVRQGGSAFYEVCLNRRDFAGPVTIQAEGLPAGVSCPPVLLSPQAQFAAVLFTAALDAPEWTGAIRLKAWAMIDGHKVDRDVRCAQRRYATPNINTSVAVRQICLAVRPKAPYGLALQQEPVTIVAGGSGEVIVTMARHWPDFKGKVQLTGLNLPPGFNMPTADLPADKSEVKIKLSVAANVPPGTYSVAVRGDAQVPYNRDPDAANRPNVRVADPSAPMYVIVAPAVKK
jgi:hypothetical protein